MHPGEGGPGLRSPRRMVALYLGVRTAVIGPGGVTMHRHTRGTVSRAAAMFGFARLKQQQTGR